MPKLPNDNSQDGLIVIDYKPRPLRITESRLLEFLTNECNFTTPEAFQQLPREEQDKMIIAAKKVGASVRLLQRLMHIGYDRFFIAGAQAE